MRIYIRKRFRFCRYFDQKVKQKNAALYQGYPIKLIKTMIINTK
jgi:hypothetical protein